MPPIPRDAASVDLVTTRSIGPRILRSREIAERLGYKLSYLLFILADRESANPKRQSVHSHFPPMKKGGVYGRRWGIYEVHFQTWLNRRL